MRRALTMFGILAVLALGTTALFVERAEAAFTVCTYKCICSVPHRCCTLNGVTTCKPDPNSPLQCTQVYNC
jgi:hypothetical protein